MSLSHDPSRLSTLRARSAMLKVSHCVPCPLCQEEFDLFAATWCEHLEGEPSKRCPHCRQCLCDHPAYREPNFWKDAPLAFRQQGFQRLFLFYL